MTSPSSFRTTTSLTRSFQCNASLTSSNRTMVLGSCVWLAFNPINIPAHWISPASFPAAVFKVAIGGFHVSGVLALLPDMTPELREALDLGVSLLAGEGEDALETFLIDRANRQPPRVYNHLSSPPSLSAQPTPFISQENLQRFSRAIGSFRCRPWVSVRL